jgi:cytochrome c nitrite reductase small subunit
MLAPPVPSLKQFLRDVTKAVPSPKGGTVYDSWQKASHHAHAKCIDCHLPHDLVGKYIAKVENGFWHSKGFTLQDFHEPIRIKPRNARLLQVNCLGCHGDVVHDIVQLGSAGDESNACVRCHAAVGHGPPR